MDPDRFDHLTRTVARRSRREALRALAGAAAALLAITRRSAQAMQATVPIGGVCYHSSQCRDDGGFGPVYCDDNGFTYDGDFNCCRYEGGFCGELDENCCGTLVCLDAHCTDVSYYRGAGEPCSSADQCRAASGALYCADNGFGYTACCAAEGDRCASDDGCCGYLGCYGGFCGYAGPLPGEALPIGAICSYAMQCSGGGYYADCAFNSAGGGPRCCLINGQGCSSDLDCCGLDVCVDSGFGAGPRCVQFPGGPCLFDDGCTAGYICLDGRCM
jgi:hypothetical protein